MKRKSKIIVLGSGGHAAVVIDLLEKLNFEIIGILSKETKFKFFLDYPILGDDTLLKTFVGKNILFANGIGVVNNSLNTRKKVFENLKRYKFVVPVLQHKNAIVSQRAILKEGSQILAGSNIGPNVFIGENTIVNTNTTVEHGSIVEAHCHLAPGSNICGNVKIGESTFIGAGSTIINDLSVTKNCLIGAGSLVVKDIKVIGKYYGHPSKKMK